MKPSMCKSLKPVAVILLAAGLCYCGVPVIQAQTKKSAMAAKKISPDLFGLFFEDINYAADGGLYAELVQNRSFEYSPTERKEWHPLSYWEYISPGYSYGKISVETSAPINAGNPAQGADSAWHPKEAAPPAIEYKTSIIQVGENFFCGHSDGIYRTSDKGKTWKLVLPSLKGKMFILSVSGNVIYALQTDSHC